MSLLARLVTSSPLRRALYATVLATLCVGVPAGAAAPDFNELIGRARSQLEGEHYVEALAIAQEAQRSAHADYRGPYYLALAYLGLGRFDEADAAAQKAVASAPTGSQASVQKLVDAVAARRQAGESRRDADAALADGLVSKAARLYEEAYKRSPGTPQLALKAADLYANRLKQPVDAARLLRRAAADEGNPAEARQAAAALATLDPTLRDIANGLVSNAAKLGPEQALQALQGADAAYPQLASIAPMRARIAAQTGNRQDLQEALRRMAKSGAATPETLIEIPRISVWLKDPEFSGLVDDLIGPVQHEVLQGRIDARWAAYRNARASYEGDAASYRERKLREEQRVRNAPAECDAQIKRYCDKYSGFFGNAVKEDECWTYQGSHGACSSSYQTAKSIPEPVEPVEPN